MIKHRQHRTRRFRRVPTLEQARKNYVLKVLRFFDGDADRAARALRVREGSVLRILSERVVGAQR